jgi:hypothetical protein
MKYHLEGLSNKQIAVLDQLAGLMSERGFYLAGGTGLSIYFGHRRSVDLDWFCPKPFGDALLLAKWLHNFGVNIENSQVSPGTLHGTIQGVRVTFLEYRYPNLQALVEWKARRVFLAGLDDIACMKLSAIAQRGLRKDFCDVYMLGIKHRPLKELLDLYSQKFKSSDISPVLYGLSYFRDAEEEPMPRMLFDVNWKTIKRAIQNWVREFTEESTSTR